MKTKNSVPICLRSKVQLTGTNMWENLFLAAWRTGNEFSFIEWRESDRDWDGEVVFGNDPGIWRRRVSSHPSTLISRDLGSLGSVRAHFMTQLLSPLFNDYREGAESVPRFHSLRYVNVQRVCQKQVDSTTFISLIYGFRWKSAFFDRFPKKMCLYFGSFSLCRIRTCLTYFKKHLLGVYDCYYRFSLSRNGKKIFSAAAEANEVLRHKDSTKISRSSWDKTWLIKHKLMLL